jgi:hypothetical protein
MPYKDRAARQQAIREKALELGVSEVTVKKHKLIEKTLETTINRQKVSEKRQKRLENHKKLAEMVVKREISFKEALERSNLSERHFQRWVKQAKEDLRV